MNDAFEAMLLTNDLGVILNRTDTFKYSLILKKICVWHIAHNMQVEILYVSREPVFQI